MMTPWFPSSIKPAHAGVYPVRTPNNEANKYCYYDHLGWRLCAGSIYDAEQRKHYKTEPLLPSMELVGSEWRGFTEKQT